MWCVRGWGDGVSLSPSSMKLWTVVLSSLQGKLPMPDEFESSLKSSAQPWFLSRTGHAGTWLSPACGNTTPFAVSSKVKAWY